MKHISVQLRLVLLTLPIFNGVVSAERCHALTTKYVDSLRIVINAKDSVLTGDQVGIIRRAVDGLHKHCGDGPYIDLRILIIERLSSEALADVSGSAKAMVLLVRQKFIDFGVPDNYLFPMTLYGDSFQSGTNHKGGDADGRLVKALEIEVSCALKEQ